MSSDLISTRVEAVRDFLDGEGAKYEILEHGETYSAAAESRATHTAPQRTAKTIVLHARGAYLLAVIPASRRLDITKVRDVLGDPEGLRFAEEAEMAKDFPLYEVGAVPPVGSMPTAEVIDIGLMAEDEIVFAAGDHKHSIRLSTKDLARLTDATVEDICED